MVFVHWASCIRRGAPQGVEEVMPPWWLTLHEWPAKEDVYFWSSSYPSYVGSQDGGSFFDTSFEMTANADSESPQGDRGGNAMPLAFLAEAVTDGLLRRSGRERRQRDFGKLTYFGKRQKVC